MSKVILVVSGDPKLQQELQLILEEMACTVVTASTGREALALLITEALLCRPVQGVLLDLEVSGLDALDTLREIQDRHEEITVVAIGDGGHRERVARALRDGVAAVVPKPIDAPLLRQFVEVFFLQGES